jgi:hypothetical protein
VVKNWQAATAHPFATIAARPRRNDVTIQNWKR